MLTYGIGNAIGALIGLVFNLLFWIIVIGGIFALISHYLHSEPQEDEVMERWSSLLARLSMSGKEFFDLVETEIVTRGLPYKGHSVELGGSFLTESHTAIKINHNAVYSCYICYEEVGTDLHLNWVLHEKIRWYFGIPIIGPWIERRWSIVSVLDRNKLLAFSAFTLDAVRNVAETLMDNHNLDKKKLVRQSSGKLGPL